MKPIQIIVFICITILSIIFIYKSISFSSSSKLHNTFNNTSLNPEKFSSKNINYQHQKLSANVDQNKKFGNIEDIVRRGELIVCALKNDSNPIFQMKTKVGYVGEDIELAKNLADALKVKLTYRMIYNTYDEVVDAIARNEGDIGIAKLSYTIERCNKVLYTEPYVNSRKVILINRPVLGRLNSNSISDLLSNKKVTIATVTNTSYESYAKQLFPNANLVSETDWENGIVKKLETGEITATIRDELRIKLLLESNPKLSLTLLPIILKDESDSMAAIINFKNTALLNWVNKYLSLSHKALSIGELITKYKEYIK
jgi:ABC-type amino acid transport substrate-binding protein